MNTEEKSIQLGGLRWNEYEFDKLRDDFVPDTSSQVPPFEKVPSHNSKTFWAQFTSDQPALFLIHGTNGDTNYAFGDLFHDSRSYDALKQRYGNRIFGFTHISIRDGVAENVTALNRKLKRDVYDLLPTGAFHNLDILTRSRGALVGRWLLEYDNPGTDTGFLEHGNGVSRLVMLGGNSQGTPASDFVNWVKTFRLSKDLKALDFPTRTTPPYMEPIQEMPFDEGTGDAKHLEILPGASDQSMHSGFLQTLNSLDLSQRTLPPYYGISTNFSCTPALWPVQQQEDAEKAKEKIDEVFLVEGIGFLENDGINPTKPALGQWDPNLPAGVPGITFADAYLIEQPGSKAFTHHVNYTQVPEVREAILRFLGAHTIP